MRGRKAGDERANVVIGQPFGQAALDDALPAAADASEDDDGAVAAALRSSQEAAERGASAVLRVAVQIQRSADFELAATHALFVAAVLRR